MSSRACVIMALGIRALHRVPIPMPMPNPTRAHGFWVGMGSILLSMGRHGWAWVSSTLPVNRDTTVKFNILLWWKLKGAPTFPIISRVAHSVLCTSASNSNSESNFLNAGNKRSGLKPTTVNVLLFVQSNQDLL
jgi:hypothetical protein